MRSLRLLGLGIDPPDSDTRAPVRNVVRHLLREPGMGEGLYERGGWRAGQRGKRTATFTRRTGTAGPVTYGLRWQGNDGTFGTPRSTVTLPLNAPVSVEVGIAARSTGAHSAILLLTEREHAI